MIDVCVCTHNPSRDIFQIILTALAQQTLDQHAYEILIIDNGSTPPLTRADLQPLQGVKFRLVNEPELGLSHARFRAIAETTHDLVIFVDDDNELPTNYLETAIKIAADHPDIGCFGGKLLLVSEITCPTWVQPLLGFLAIKDLGDAVISGCAPDWQPWEPPGAGVVIRRAVLNHYVDRLRNLPQAFQLDRKGKQGLLSGGDSLIMRGAYELGLKCAYHPSLRLNHHIPSSRFKFSYLLKLMFGYGRSNVRLDQILNRTVADLSIMTIIDEMRQTYRAKQFQSWRHAVCVMALYVGRYYEQQAGKMTKAKVD
jgi:Glycosyl transferase family 2